MKKTDDLDIVSLCESKGLKYICRFIKNEQTYLKCVCANHYEPYEFEISFRNLRNLKHNCPKCAGKNLTTKDIKYKVETLLNVPVEIIGEYVNMRTPIDTICKKCGNNWKANVVSLCQGSGCNKCKKGKPLKSHEVYVEDLFKVQPNLEVISLYNGDAKDISYRCKIDGYVGVTKAGRLLSKNTQCRYCVLKKLKGIYQLSQSEFIDRMKQIAPDIEVLSKYDGFDRKVKLLCKKHDYMFEQSAQNALQGKCGCVKCVSSKGEKKIINILSSLKVRFKSQFKFDDCRAVNPLPFDFYLPDYNMVIEYQGEQHYKPVQFGGMPIEEAIRNFDICKAHDEIKSNYCDRNNIKLLSIPYTEFDNLEKIIKNNV